MSHYGAVGLTVTMLLMACEPDPRSQPASQSAAAAPAAATPTSAPLTFAPADTTSLIHWPTPAGWEHETIPFPFAFAPALAFTGVEELRFAPGFYKPDAPGWWSYDIVWWITSPPDFAVPAMQDALTTYFRGLATTVARGKFRVDPAAFRTELARDAATGALTGQVHSVDGFTTGRPVTLNVVARLRACPKAGRHAVTFQLSPRPRTDPIWRDLDATLAGFTCE